MIPQISLTMGTGWMMEVALHPDYEENGWIYIHYGDRCEDCNDASRKSGRPVSMNTIVRGRIKDGQWIDEETIWQVEHSSYTLQFDMAAGGRIALDDTGHVFFSVGFKGPLTYTGIQDLSQPYGKIHRVHDDGRIPEDNPYAGDPDVMGSVWSYGHRSQQGLEFDRTTGELWSTEMGPRGGDELNLIRPGLNYGWPLVSKGLNYDGTPVEYGKHLGIKFDPDDLVEPLVDWTPSPAVSSFIIYEGDDFPKWHRNLIVGTLKARELYRLELKGNEVVHSETLLTNLARIRDIETGPDGTIYLLLEHGSGGKIMRLVPVR
jgi:glucose/arabinose dehydrogenase